MHIFNRSQLCVTRSQQDADRICGKLTAAGIEFSVRSAQPTNPGRHHGIPGIRHDAACEYRIYVSKKDATRAEQALR